MLALLLLAAALGQTAGPPPASAPREWRLLNNDARYEVSGHMVSGVFRYDPASRRLRAARATYGVNLDPADGLIMGSVRGTDYSLARDLAELERRFELKDKAGPAGAPVPPATTAPASQPPVRFVGPPAPELPPLPEFEHEGPCPGPYCPDRKPDPKPKPLIPIEPLVWETKHMVIAIIVGLISLVLGLLWTAFCILLLFVVCRWLYYKATAPAPTAAPAPPADRTIPVP